MQPIAPALAELLNPAINRGDAGMGSGTGLQPPPDNSWDRRAGGEAAAHRARASTKGTSEDVAKRDVLPSATKGLEEAPQANYGTSATIPTLDPELARQLGLPTAEDDDEALARPPRSKMEAFGVKATADALENLIRDGRPEFKGDDGQTRVWAPHRPPRPEKSEGGVPFVIKSEYEPKGDQPTAIKELVEGISRNDRTQVLLGVTGSGKTYTMAKVIEATQRPAIILAPNKTLAAQLYGEFKSFFPDNAVEYFVRITTTTSRKPTSRAPTPTSKKTRPSTSRSTACAIRRRARCWNATTSSSSLRSPASTVSARSKPIPR